MNCNCSHLKNICTSELLRELDRRMDNKQLEWDFKYFYDSGKVSMNLKGQDCKEFSLAFKKELDLEVLNEYRKNYKAYVLNSEKNKSVASLHVELAMDLIHQIKTKNN